jgi:hypothetical protein
MLLNSKRPVTRRELLRQLGNGFGTIGLASVLANEGLFGASAEATVRNGSSATPLAPRAPHFTPRAKHVIFLFMNGGPSQVDTFDPKPALEKYKGQTPPYAAQLTDRVKDSGLLPSPWKFHKYGQSGIEVSDLYPHVASCADDLCVLRSMTTTSPNHSPSLLMMNSGEMTPTRPSMGSWLCYGLGTENQNLPGFVVLCPGKPIVGPQLWNSSFLPSVYQGMHINNGDLNPKNVIEHIANHHLPRREQRRQLDLLRRMNEAHAQAHGSNDQLEARIASLEMAYRMQFEAQEAFDISLETPAHRKLYGEGPYASACLIARRLVERGVRMVQIYYGGGQPWDDHADILNHKNHARATDQPTAALLNDLKSRGLLDDTIVLWGGEFGRTPVSEGAKGRDHNNRGFTMWLAGGGFKGGHVHGATDEFGALAVDKKMHVHDLHATILHQLGIDHERLTFRYSGRDFRLTDVHGQVVHDILA